MNTMKSIRPVTRNQKQMAFKQFLNDYLILIGIVILTVYTCIVQPSFLAPGNLLSLVRQFVPLGMVSLGMTLVVIGGYIDLSVAGIFSFMGIVSAMLLNKMGPSSLIIVLIVGAACGLLNAVILVKCGARDDSDALFTVMANALNILGIDPNMQNVWKGVILVAAIWLDSRRTV